MVDGYTIPGRLGKLAKILSKRSDRGFQGVGVNGYRDRYIIRNVSGEIFSHHITGTLAIKLLGRLFEKPVVSIADIVKHLKITCQSAAQLVKKFVQSGILKEITVKQICRKYLFLKYFEIIVKGTR